MFLILLEMGRILECFQFVSVKGFNTALSWWTCVIYPRCTPKRTTRLTLTSPHSVFSQKTVQNPNTIHSLHIIKNDGCTRQIQYFKTNFTFIVYLWTCDVYCIIYFTSFLAPMQTVKAYKGAIQSTNHSPVQPDDKNPDVVPLGKGNIGRSIFIYHKMFCSLYLLAASLRLACYWTNKRSHCSEILFVDFVFSSLFIFEGCTQSCQKSFNVIFKLRLIADHFLNYFIIILSRL